MIFHLNKPDTTFQYVLTYPGAGAIVDEDVFPADEKLADDEVIGSGPYKLSQYKSGEQAVLELNDEYTGDNAGQGSAGLRRRTTSDAVRAEAGRRGRRRRHRVAQPEPDRPHRPQGATAVTVAEGDGAEIRYWVWDVDKPGRQGPGRPPGRRPGDRPRRRSPRTAYDNTVTPLYSIVPPGFAGADRRLQGEVRRARTSTRRRSCSTDAGIKTPVDLTIGYTPTHYGPNAVDEATELQRQLEDSGLFKVQLKSAEWEQYQTIYKEGAYDLWQLGWFPDFLDADNYLSPFMVDGGFFQNEYSNEEVNELVAHEQASDGPGD